MGHQWGACNRWGDARMLQAPTLLDQSVTAVADVGEFTEDVIE